MAPTEINLPYSHLPRQGEGDPLVVWKLAWPYSSVTFYDNIMTTLATELVNQFYTHQQVQDNQAVLIISLKKISIIFKMELCQKAKFFFWAEEYRLKLVHHT
jgi:hypothetical protein